MTDKQAFPAIIDGMASAVLRALLFALVLFLLERLAHLRVDGGDDGWGLFGIVFMVLFGIAGFIFSARWVRRRYPEYGSQD